jgi:endonuclease YncB( thermonuclease family)
MNDPWTPTPVPSATPLPEEAFGLIADIVDAQTVRVVLQGDSLNQIYTVRLIGVDPLPNVSSQPWGVVAYEQINHWLGGKLVRLVQDTTVADSSGVLPRYVYLNEDDMINLMMIEMGLARPSFQSPDTEFQTEFQQAADNAEADQRGLWGPAPTATPTRTPTVEGEEPEQATPTMTTTPALTITPAVDTTAATATPAAAATLTATTVITAPVP